MKEKEFLEKQYEEKYQMQKKMKSNLKKSLTNKVMDIADQKVEQIEKKG